MTEWGPYGLLAGAVLNFVVSFYNRRAARLARRKDEEMVEEERRNRQWRDSVDRKLRIHQRKFDVLKGPVRSKLGVDLKLEE